MSAQSVTIITTSITAIVTIIGFIITYFLNRRNFKEEINNQKINIHLEKTGDLPYKVLKLIDLIIAKKEADLLTMFQEMTASIFAYGSAESIKIVTRMQELNYAYAKDVTSVDKNTLIAYYILLICQMKNDLTGIEISPEFWYRMRLTDYSVKKEFLDKTTNAIVEKLELESFLRI